MQRLYEAEARPPPPRGAHITANWHRLCYLIESMTQDELKPSRRFWETDAGDLSSRPESDTTVLQVALLGLLTILLLTFTAWLTYANGG